MLTVFMPNLPCWLADLDLDTELLVGVENIMPNSEDTKIVSSSPRLVSSTQYLLQNGPALVGQRKVWELMIK